MRRYIVFCLLLMACSLSAQAPQKTYDWQPQNADVYRVGPGYHSAVAVYNTHGWEALRMRLEINSRSPISIGVVRLEDWNNAINHPDRLSALEYACLTEGVTRMTFTCNFNASYTSRVVVVRDTRHSDYPTVTGIAAPLVRRGMNELFANEITVVPYRWTCVSNCDLPDPPQYSWVDLRHEKYEITPAFKSYGPFTPEQDNDQMRICVKAQIPVTVAVVTNSQADAIYAQRGQAHEVLSKSNCKQYGTQASTFECTFQLADGPLQVIVLPEVEVKKKKKAEITISTVRCTANCVAAKE